MRSDHADRIWFESEHGGMSAVARGGIGGPADYFLVANVDAIKDADGKVPRAGKTCEILQLENLRFVAEDLGLHGGMETIAAGEWRGKREALKSIERLPPDLILTNEPSSFGWCGLKPGCCVSFFSTPGSSLFRFLVGDGALGCGWGVGALERADLIAEVCGAFEFEFGGCLAHLFFEFGDDAEFVVFLGGLGNERLVEMVGFLGVFAEHLQAFLECAFHALWGDAMFGVVGFLAGSPVFGDLDERLNRIGDDVAEKHALTGDVAGGSAGGLDQ